MVQDKSYSIEISKNIKAVIFDFDGVLCHDFYYKKLKRTHPEIFKHINEDIFRKHKYLVKSWMRGKISYKTINLIISDNFDISPKILEKSLITGIKEIKLDKKLLTLARSLKKKKIKIAIATDNMDVFSLFAIKALNLNKYFDYIFCSSDYGLLKTDKNGELFDLILKIIKIEPKAVLVIDDSEDIAPILKQKNINFFLFSKI